MAKYRSKEIVEAFKWEGEVHMDEYPEWFQTAVAEGTFVIWGDDVYMILCSENQYIIKKRGFDIECGYDAESFEQRHEEVSDD